MVRDSEEDRFVGEANAASRFAQQLLHQLRKTFPVIYSPQYSKKNKCKVERNLFLKCFACSGNTSKQLSRAIGNPLQPFAAIFVGPDEIAKGKLTIKVLSFTSSHLIAFFKVNSLFLLMKELDTSKMEEVPIATLVESLRKLQTTAPAAQAPIPKTATSKPKQNTADATDDS